MKTKTLHDEYLKDKEFARIMAQEDLIMDVTENFCRILDEEKLNRSRLAQIMGKTKGYVSQLLNGNRNITLRVLSDIAYSLGYTVRIRVQKRGAKTEPANLKLVLDTRNANKEKFFLKDETVWKTCANFENRLSRIGQ
jgi:transcriptional regulator with XRE-family HTH domain